jgi:Ras family protein A
MAMLIVEFSRRTRFGSSGKPLKKCERKAVLAGDGACGKSALFRVLTEGRFPEEYCCGELFWNRSTNIEIGDTSTELAVWDTAGQEDYDRLRPLFYPDAHVVLICFSIGNPDSLANIHETWLPEVSHFCAGVPIVLVGTKSDLRYDGETLAELHKTSEHPITYEEALEAQIKIGAKAYVECSAKLGEGVAEVFETAVRCALKWKPVKETEKSVKAKRRRSLLRMFGMSRD